MTVPAFLQTRKGRAVPKADVPELPLSAFRTEIIEWVVRGDRLAALFGCAHPECSVELWAVLASDRAGLLRLARTRVSGNAYSSITPECPEAHLFEREIAQHWAVIPEGHPWLKPVRFVSPLRVGADV